MNKSGYKTNLSNSLLQNESIQRTLVLLLYVIVAFALYHKTLGFGYVLDDQIVITSNSFTQKGFSGIPDILTTESFTGFFGEQKDLVQGARYRPLSIITFAMEKGIWGMNPGISHAINIVLYSLVAFMIFILIRLLYSSPRKIQLWSIAFLTASLYLVHPLHTEAVANIKGRDEILVFLFSILSLLATLKWENSGKWRYGLLAGIAIFLGLLSKENAITFLAVIPVTLFLFCKTTLRNIFIKSIPIIIATVAYLIIRWKIIGYLWSDSAEITDVMNNPFYGMSLGEKYASISFTLWKYIQLSIFPYSLSHDYYPYAIPILQWGDPRAYLSLLLYVILSIAGVWIFIKRHKNGYGLLFYLFTLTIVSNLVVNVGTFMNERFLFISSMGICLLMAVGLYKLSERNTLLKWASIIIYLLSITGYSWKTLDRVPAWENALSLNTSAVKTNPGSARANSFMSTALYNEWRVKPPSEEKKQAMLDAYLYAEGAIKVLPKYRNAQLMKAGVAAELYKFDNDLSILLFRFSEVASYRPDVDFILTYMDYLHNRVKTETLVDWYYEIGYKNVFLNQKNPGWAIKYLEQGREIAPRDKKIIQGLAEIYQSVGNQQSAEKYFNLLSEL